MPDSLMESFSLLRRSVEQTETILQETDDPGRDAAGIAGVLRTLWPASPLFACRLGATGAPLRALDQNGAERPDWIHPLEVFLSRHESEEEPPPRYLASLPSELLHAGHSLAVQHIEYFGQPEGVLLLAVPDTASAETISLFWELMRVYSAWLAVRIALDAERQQRTRLSQIFAEQTELADLAALASPVTHEFNNFLNTLILQLMVLANQVPEQFRADLRAIGQQGKAVAGLVRQWQQHRAQHRAASRRLDLNAIVREVAEWLAQKTAESATPLILKREGETNGTPTNGTQLRLSLASDLRPVEGTPLELRLLLRLLMSNAAATITTRPGSIQISTNNEGNMVLISVEDTGPAIAPAMLPRMFEPSVETREGASQLEMAACEALVQRRLRGRIDGENRAGGGVAVHVRLRPA